MPAFKTIKEKCRFCNERFRLRATLWRHVDKEHREELQKEDYERRMTYERNFN